MEVVNIKEDIFPYVLHQLHKVWTQLDGLKLNKIDFFLCLYHLPLVLKAVLDEAEIALAARIRSRS